MATLTFVYADSTAVIGPLSQEVEPHAYDLCADHAAGFTVPNGWEVVVASAPLAPTDDVLALARALSTENSEGNSRVSFNTPNTQNDPAPTSQRSVRHLTVMRSPHHD